MTARRPSRGSSAQGRGGALASGREALAGRHWERALELLSDPSILGSLTGADLDGLGEASWWLGRLGDAIQHRERAFRRHQSEGEPVRAALTALALAADYSHRSESSIAAGWVRRAERLLDGQPESSANGWLLRPQLNQAVARGDLDGALALADRILELGNRLGDRDLEAIGLQDRGRVLVALGRVAEGLDAIDEAVVAAVSGEVSPFPTAIVYCNATVAAEDLTDYRRAGEFAEVAERWCERQSIAGFPGMCRVRRVELIRLRGAWAEAEAEARRACAELIDFSHGYAAEGFYQIGEIRRRMGDLSGAEDAYSQAHRLGRDPSPGLALLVHARGQSDAAAGMLAAALAEPSATPLVRARILPAEVEVAIAIRDLGRARAAADELHAIAGTYDTHLLRAEAATAQGLVEFAAGATDQAIGSLRAAVRAWQATGAPYEIARARLALGEALLATDSGVAASLELTAAAEAFETLGAATDLVRARERAAAAAVDAGSAARARRATRTFMFTDVVGSTNLIDAVGDEAWGRLLAWHDTTIRELLRDHGGQEVHHAGDGFFVAFTSADAALDCALAIRRSFRAHRREHGYAPSIRIGLHVAEALHTTTGYEGAGVHAAARIGALAGADEILVSRQVVTSTDRPVAHGAFRPVTLRGFREPFEVALLD